MDSINPKSTMTSAEKAERIMAIADDIKADRIEMLDIGKKTSVCDYFVICTGTSDTHVNAILERVIEKLKEDGIRHLRKNIGGTGWELVDYGDVVLHVMREETRQFYDLETLWTNMQTNPDLI
jgi:ribosome-associated protein